MKIVVCIGSSCHLNGSRQVIEQLQDLIEKHNLHEQVEFGGTFCMQNCQSGVCVTVDEKMYSLSPETTHEFFEAEVLSRVSVS